MEYIRKCALRVFVGVVDMYSMVLIRSLGVGCLEIKYESIGLLVST